MFKLLTNNWTFKVTSLLFALVLWMFIMGERRLEVSYRVPIELQNVPRELMIASDIPSMVDIRISGPRTLQMKISPSDISIIVDLADLQPGLTTFKGLEERLNLPSGLRVTRLSPSYIDLKLERVKQKLVPIKIALEGEPLPGFKLGKIVVIPSEVTIKGGETELKNVTEVTTEAVDLNGVNEGFSLIVPLIHDGTYTHFKDEKTAEVQVEIIPSEALPTNINDNSEQ
ncbi:MAG: YbbR-like domain-containing protein [Desulfuromonadales bacterium]|nr:YbbR-like domain-containing protein [Desulfuromonadales bacterium]